MTGAFKATYVFGYVVAVMFMLFCLILIIFQGAVTKELGICEWACCSRQGWPRGRARVLQA